MAVWRRLTLPLTPGQTAPNRYLEHSAAPRHRFPMAPLPHRQRIRGIAALPAALGLLLNAGAALAQADGPAAKGAQVYCFMRNSNNNHELSWSAAYALIKRQGSGMFKTSPEHAAVMITEAVVQNPASFPGCGRYLGDLYLRRLEETGCGARTTSEGGFNGAGSGGMTRSDRSNN